MAIAALLSPSFPVPRESEYQPRKIQQWTTGLGKDHVDNCLAFLSRKVAGTKMCTSSPREPTWRCDDSARGKCGDVTPTTGWTGTAAKTSGISPARCNKSTLVVELLEVIERTLEPYGTPPPSYDEALHDVPPDYSSTDSLAQAKVDREHSAPPPIEREIQADTRSTILRDPTMSFAVDFGDTSGFQSHGKKKAKQAAKKAQQAKWAESGDEENKEGEEGEEGEGGGGGDGGSGGAGDGSGDNGDGGAGDDDGDDWLGGGGKKNKKKKGKNNKDEEEEKRKKEEEEEKKRKEEEAAANPLSWADETGDANPDDEWGGFTAAGKKKKGKKGKVDEVPPAPPPPPEPPTSAFHDINLDDGAPQLDLSFSTTTKSKNDFGFGSFGNSWNTGGSNWDFGGVGTATTTDVKESKSTKDSKDARDARDAKDAKDTKESKNDLGDNNPWSSSGTKAKGKKKQTFSSFDFGDLGGGEDTAANDNLTVDAAKDTKDSTTDDWGTFTTANKKDKKKKKNVIEEEPVQEPAVVMVPEPEPEADDWMKGAWGTAGKKEKKKAKKGVIEEELVPPPPPPPPPPPVAPAAKEPEVDEWSTFGSKKDKKKIKKGTAAEGSVKSDDIVAVHDPEPVAEDTWTSASKKEKKNKKKGVFATEAEDDLIPAIIDVSSPPAENDIFDSSWFSTGASKKDKKGNKKGLVEEVKEEPVPAPDPVTSVADTALGGDDDWMSAAWGAGKKSKKTKKKDELVPVIEALPAIVDVTADDIAPPAVDFGWSETIKKKDKKGARKPSVSDKSDGLPPPPLPAPAASEPAKTDEWDIWNTGKSTTKDKRGKKGKILDPEPEPPAVVVPEPEASKESETGGIDDTWGGSTWGLSAKDKKKREKELKKKGIVEPIDEPKPSLLTDSFTDPPPPPPEEDTWGSLGGWGTTVTKDKKKGKKGKQADEPPPPAPTPPAQGLTPEPSPPPIPDFDGPDLNGWGSLTKTESKITKPAKKGTLSRTTTSTSIKTTKEDTKLGLSKTKSKDSKDKNFDLLDFDDSKDIEPEPEAKEAPAAAVKSFWGGFGPSTATSKSKLTKEKEDKKAKEAQEKEAALEEDPIVEVVDEAPKKGTKSKISDSKVTKVDSKGSDKSSKSLDKKKKDDWATLLDIPEEKPVDKKAEKGKATDAKLKKGESKVEEMVKEKEKEKEKEKDKASDVWGMWGGTKKTAGKKADESKKEITQQTSANQRGALVDFANDPEPAAADEASATPKIMSSATKSKLSAKGSVADRIKALDQQSKSSTITKDRKKATDPDPPPPPPAAPEPPKADKSSKDDSPLKKSATLTKTKSPTATKTTASSSKKKDTANTSPVEEKKISKDSVPGSFPADDDLFDIMDLAPSPMKTAKKSTKVVKPTKPSQPVVEAPMPPTPPPEPVVEKTPKKERAKVVRDSGSSWGFWGSPPPKKEVKKVVKAKDDSDVSPTTAKKEKSPPALTRSKSTKTPKESEKEAEKDSKSSDSDKGKRSEARSRPSTSRGMFSSFMMPVPPPARVKSTRRSSTAAVSKSTSRRQSMDVDDFGMVSPPPDDGPGVSGKAAKLLGESAGKSMKKEVTRGKQKAKAVPDPFPIDDDDMVMVNSIEDPIINAPVPKASKTSRKEVGSKSKPLKREVGPKIIHTPAAEDPLIRPLWEPEFERLGANGKLKYKQSKVKADPQDDIVMVEAGPSTDAPEVTTGPDDFTSVEKPRQPPPLKRSATSARKSGGGLGGLFGFGRPRRASDSNDRPRPKSVYREEENGRRTKEVDRKNRRSIRVDTDADGFTTDGAPAGGETEPEDADMLRAERKSNRVSREAEQREAEERRARRREAEKTKLKEARDKRAREEEEREERRREEKRVRRAARDERLTREEQGLRDVDARAAERRDRHRTRDLTGIDIQDGALKSSSRPRTTERHRSQVYPRSGDEEIETRPKPERRRSHMDRSGDDHRRHGDKSSRRKSAIVGDYFDSHHGARQPAEPPILENPPKDKTSSWVHSQADDPPEAPPIEPTILDTPALANGSGGYDDGLSAEEEARRDIRHRARRSSKYAGMTETEMEERKRRKDQRRAEKEQLRSSEGSGNGDGERERERDRGSRRKSVYMDGGAERLPERTQLGAGVKRGSWFKRLGNL